MSEYTYVDADTGKPISELNQQRNTYIPTGSQVRGEKADLLDKIRPEEVAEIIRHKLLGESYDTKTQKWVFNEALKDLALTELGAEQFSNLMLAVSTRNVSISKLIDREIKDRVLSICKTAMYMALENWYEYGIKRTSQLYFLYEIIFSNSLVVLKQPENDGIKKLISSTINESRVYSEQQEKKSGGLLGLFRWRGE